MRQDKGKSAFVADLFDKFGFNLRKIKFFKKSVPIKRDKINVINTIDYSALVPELINTY